MPSALSGDDRARSSGRTTDDEVAFYDALETNDSAVKVLGKVFKGLRKDLIYVNEKALSVGADLMRKGV